MTSTSSWDCMAVTDANLQSVIARMGGDIDLLLSLLSLLEVHTQVWIDECDVLICNRDRAGACRWLHTLRGTMGSLGFEDFSRSLNALEHRGRSQSESDLDEWWDSIAEIRDALQRLPATVPSLVDRLNASRVAESGA